MYSDVPGELVAAAEPAIALLHGAGVRPLVHRRLARPVLVLQKVPSEANPKVRNHGEGPY